MDQRRFIGSELGNNPDQHWEILGGNSNPIPCHGRLSTLVSRIVFACCLTSHKGQTLQGRSDCGSGDVGCPSIATGFCDATKKRDVPVADNIVRIGLGAYAQLLV